MIKETLFKFEGDEIIYKVHNVTDDIIEITYLGELVQYDILDFETTIKPHIIVMTKNDIIQQAAKYSLDKISKHPLLATEINDLFILMESEIEEGGSLMGEYENFIAAVDNLIEEQN